MDKVTAVAQIGIVVRDVKATVANYEKLLGISEWHFQQVDTEHGLGRNFTKDDKPTEQKALVACALIGDVEIELIEPQDDHSLHAEFLRESGPGLHHVLFTTADYDSSVEKLKAVGIGSLANGELGDARFEYLDTRDLLGLIAELAVGDPDP